MKLSVLIVGYGFVGKATEYLLASSGVNINIHDPAAGHPYVPAEADYIFLCVPTPLDRTGGKLNMSILRQVYDEWRGCGKIVIRSTIGPDQLEDFPDAIIMPEFLREKNWKEDVDNKDLPLIIGSKKIDPKLVWIFRNTTKEIIHLKPKEASMFKLARNTALAMRVALANEYYDICERERINYNAIENLLSTDVWIGGTHWKVPGPDGNLGFGGSCFPKDLTHMSSLCYNKCNMMLDALMINETRRLPDESIR